MNATEEYIISQPEHLQPLFKKLRSVVLHAADSIDEKIRFGIPFFDYYGWFCYLSPYKKDRGVYIAFLRGFELSNEQGILEAGDRKMVKTITYTYVKDIEEQVLTEIIQEALWLNEQHHQNKKKK